MAWPFLGATVFFFVFFVWENISFFSLKEKPSDPGMAVIGAEYLLSKYPDPVFFYRVPVFCCFFRVPFWQLHLLMPFYLLILDVVSYELCQDSYGFSFWTVSLSWDLRSPQTFVWSSTLQLASTYWTKSKGWAFVANPWFTVRKESSLIYYPGTFVYSPPSSWSRKNPQVEISSIVNSYSELQWTEDSPDEELQQHDSDNQGDVVDVATNSLLTKNSEQRWWQHLFVHKMDSVFF